MAISRLFGAVAAGARGFFSNIWRTAKELFHEITGFFFYAVAVWFLLGNSGVVSTYRRLGGDVERQGDAVLQLAVVGGLALMFAWFGFSSFRRAKHVHRGQ